jgi:TorA maturation chaperone TorD
MSAQTSILTASRQEQATRALARSEVYLFLARSFSYPRQSLSDLHHRAQQAVQVLGKDRLKLIRQLEVPPLAELETQYIRAFGHTMQQTSPAYEAEYDQGHIFMQSQSMAELAGFYRAFGAEAASGERLDHIGTELEFMYYLSYKESYALASDTEEGAEVCRDGQRRFLEKHLGYWGPLFLRGLESVVGGLYRPLSRVTLAWLEMEAKELGAHPQPLGEETGSDVPLPSLFEFDESLSPCQECEEVEP